MSTSDPGAPDAIDKHNSSGGPRLWTALGLGALLALALSLRLYGINWDQGGLFHPDERAVLMHTNDIAWPSSSELGTLTSAEESPLNPHWFNYGSLPMYMLKAVQSVGSTFASDGTVDLFDLRIPGRAISALADTLTVLLVFVLASRVYGRRVGFIAAALSALAVIQIQLAHFYAFDGVMTTFIVAGVFFSVRVAQHGRMRDSALAGLMLGLGLATKFSVAPLALTVFLAHIIYAFSKAGEALDVRGATATENAPRHWHAYKGLAIAVVTGLVAVLVTQPYMLIDRATFAANVSEQSQMVRRILDYPYTRQYIDTPRFLYQAWQTGVWGLGPVAGVVTWTGLLVGLVVAALTRRKADIVILSWLIPYLLITGWFEVKFMRYMLPAVPFLLIYGARLLSWLGDGVAAIWPRRRWLVLAPAALVLLLTAHYALAFTSMYGGKHPAQQVHDYLDANAQAFDGVLQEHWEEGIPNVPRLIYPDRLGMYEPDTSQKFEIIAGELTQAKYFVIYSNRLYATLPRLPDRYPLSTKFYAALFDGSLGYELVFTGQKERSFLGVTYRDDPFARTTPEVAPPVAWRPPTGELATFDFGWADESFTVYEHPVSFVFRNTGSVSEFDMLVAIGGFQSTPISDTSRQLGLQLSAEDAAIQQAGGSWNDIFFARDVPVGVAVILWLVAVQVIALAALPLAFTLFRSLPDRGYLLAKPLGILLAAVVAWLLASLRLVEFSAWSVAFGVLVVATASVVALQFNRAEFTAFLRQHKKSILFAEAVFLAAFLLFLAVRFANPDLWHPYRGGEKPMDLAYLTAVTRSTVMPPYDPWFSGGYLNYYYFGQFITASLIRLTGIEIQVAYNLAVPLFFALTAGAAFSVVYNLAELTRRARGLVITGISRSAVTAGLLAVALVAVAGNIDGLVQLWQNTVGNMADANGVFSFDFWRSSRMMPPDPPGNEITEFPFFTFLFADLHAHLIAIPFALLALGLTLAVFVRAGQGRPRVETWLTLGVLGVVTGALRVINTWDFPTSMVIALLLIGAGEMLAKPLRPVAAVVKTVVKVLFVAAVGYVVFLPFHRNFELFNNGVIRSLTVTEVWRYFYIHSLFLFVLLSWAFFELRDGGGLRAALDWFTSRWNGDWLIVAAIALCALPVTLAAAGFGTVALTVTVAVGVTLAAIAAAASGKSHWRYVIPAAVLSAVALLIGAAVDLTTVKGDIDRMNTVFKFYLHAWVLFGLASAYFLWLMATDGRLSLRSHPTLVSSPSMGEGKGEGAMSGPLNLEAGSGEGRARMANTSLTSPVADAELRHSERAAATRSLGRGRLSPARIVWLGVLVALLFGVMVYPVLGTKIRVADRFDTGFTGLDGMEYMELALQNEKDVRLDVALDRAGIEWLRESVEGSPVIVEGLTDQYHWGGRISVYTGLPAVIGWDWHQRQQRVDYDWAVTQRRAEVNNFYTTTSPTIALNFLESYGVRYVYVGELERVYYPAEGIAKLATLQDRGLHVVYASGPVTIYEYRPGTVGVAAVR